MGDTFFFLPLDITSGTCLVSDPYPLRRQKDARVGSPEDSSVGAPEDPWP